jgi:hypothetical protein
VLNAAPSVAELDTFNKVVPALRNRIKVFSEAVPLLQPLFGKPKLDADRLATAGGTARDTYLGLVALKGDLNRLEAWTEKEVETAVKTVVSTHTLGKGIYKVLREALTAADISLPMYAAVALLGRSETIARLDDATRLLEDNAQPLG